MNSIAEAILPRAAMPLVRYPAFAALRDGARRYLATTRTRFELRHLPTRMLDDVGVPGDLRARIEAERELDPTRYRHLTRALPAKTC